ncbi:FAD/NAD(P)-binding domain-containing protein [Stipitochalara longipes BDJ]|nr:FAD/NAD(P)-binding domain-containing protein [Stipitochalara longipes BDJ]
MTTSQPNPDHYDLLVLGSGEAGKFLAWTLSSEAHQRCAVIERRWLGGSCPNVACLPSKNFVHSANVVYDAKHGHSYGIQDSHDVVAMTSVRERKRDMVKGLMDMHAGRFKDFDVELIWGEGKFVGRKSIEVTGESGKRVVTAEKVVVCTGSRARIDDTPGLKAAKPLTHIEILELHVVPSHLVVLGGGYVGLEFAQAMRRLGAQVTVVERNKRLVKNEDQDIADVLIRVLEKEGVKICTETTIKEVSGESGSSVTLKGSSSGQHVEFTGSHILCATGRLPNTENIGLKEAGINLTSKGFIETNENLETSSEGVFAVGDCAGSPNFTHVAFDDFRIVKDVLMGKTLPLNRRSGRQVPFTLFTTPELAHVGLREHEATSQGIKFRLAKLPMAGFLKTRTLGETTGFAKTLIAEDDTILGFTAVGVGAGELLPVVQLAMKRGLPYTDISEMVITHPTLSEGLVFLFSGVPAKSGKV